VGSGWGKPGEKARAGIFYGNNFETGKNPLPSFKLNLPVPAPLDQKYLFRQPEAEVLATPRKGTWKWLKKML